MGKNNMLLKKFDCKRYELHNEIVQVMNFKY